MRYTVAFGAVALVAALGALSLPWWPSRLGLTWIALSFGAIAGAYGGVGPRVLGKRFDGRLPGWSYVLNGPFLLFGLASMRLYHLWSKEEPFHEVAPGLWLGRRASRRDRAAYEALAPTAVLDLCAELPPSRVMTGTEAYLPLPVLDGDAPSAEQLEGAVRFVDAHRAHGKVLVHCALGHSRSATVVGAWMLTQGWAGPVEALEEQLRASRKGVWFTPPQHRSLVDWRRRIEARRS